MRNYITLNGKNSNEINGLLIQELPPISKPQIRTEVEEIDGRDGDIVTKLGFAAYDKEFTVGLYRDFDINEIIAYFNSEGTVIFSNESDKYYNYQIIDQIDFERLVRYRTATVRMHCQPFKYSNTEGARTLGNKGTASGEGSFITLDNTPEAQFSKIDPKGNATQSILPDEYQAVEYIKSNATQYIDTGVQLGANDFAIETGVVPTADASYEQPFFSIWTSAYGYWNWLKTGQNLDCYTSGHHYINGGATTGTYYDLKLSRAGNTWNQSSNSDSDSWTFSPSAVNNTTIKLFNRGDLNGKTNAQLYYLRIFVAGELVRNYVPCYRKSDSAIGLYDLVKGTFSTSAGTDNFTKGTDTGSPAPTCPQDVQVVTGENVVKIVGKNLFDTEQAVTRFENFAGAVVSGWGTYADGIVTNTKSNGAYGFVGFAGFKPTLQEGQTYTLSAVVRLSGSNTGTAVRIGTGYNTNTAIYISSKDAWLPVSRTFTATAQEASDSRITIQAWNTGNIIEIKDIQLELGNSASGYEPYQGQEFPIDLGSIELAKIGNYQDRIYKDSGKWYIEKQVGKVVLDGTEDGWNYNSGNKVFFIRNNDAGTDYPSGYSGYVEKLSNYFTYYAQSGNNASLADGLYENTAPSYLAMMLFHYSTITSLADWKTWLSTHNTTVYYALETPTTTEITDQTLIDQLEALYNQAHAYKGRTHVAAIAQGSNAPHIIEAEVQRSSDGNITNNGNIVSKPTLTIYGSGNIGVSLNGYQILEITLGDEEYITIDTAAMEAYKDTLDNLKNRLVNGDYSKFALRPGSNMIEFSGTVSKCVISKYSRWL